MKKNKIVKMIVYMIAIVMLSIPSASTMSNNLDNYIESTSFVPERMKDSDTKIDFENTHSTVTSSISSFLTPKWTFDPLGNHTDGSITLADVDEDGYLEIMFSSGFNVMGWAPGWTYVLRHNGTVQPGWPQSTESEPQHTPAAADIDPSYPGLEIITTSQIPTVYTEYTYAWHSDGTLVDGWPFVGGTPRASAAIGDIDSDNLLEVIYPTDMSPNSEDYGVHVRNGDGTEVEGWPYCINRHDESSTPAVADIDDDGDLEVIIVHGQKLYAFHHDNSSVDGWPVNIYAGIGTAPPVLADIDGDDDLEIFTTSSAQRVFAFHHDGESVEGWPTTVDYTTNTVSLGDFNGDGGIDIVGQSGRYVYAWNAKGESLPGWPVEGDNYCCIEHLPVLGDIDGDDTIELVLTTNDGLDAFHNNGTRVPGFPIEYPKTERFTKGSPALGDIDADGKLELVAVIEGDVMAWDCEGSKVEWSMFMHDCFHTGLYGFDPTLPMVNIVKPTDGLYILDRMIIPMKFSLILGKITVEANVSGQNIINVEFYVDGVLKYNDTTAPYSWLWEERAFFKHTIEVVAYNAGGQRSDEIIVRKFF